MNHSCENTPHKSQFIHASFVLVLVSVWPPGAADFYNFQTKSADFHEGPYLTHALTDIINVRTLRPEWWSPPPPPPPLPPPRTLNPPLCFK